MNKKSIRDLSLKGRRVLMRVDFNCPIEGGKVADDTRIAAALPTVKHVLDQGGSLVLMSHLGRPKGKPDPAFSLKPVADRLAQRLGRNVQFASDCVGAAVKKQALALKPGEVLLLENVRFHPEEEGKARVPEGASPEEEKRATEEMKRKQQEFAKQLAELGEVYVNDAFGSAHRAHASTAVLTRYFKEKVAGLLMEKEINYLGEALASPKRPFVAILGGAKISGKIDVITHLLGKVDALLIGGGMAYTFYRAQGYGIGKSIVEEDKIDLARATLEKARAMGVQLLLPEDNVIADAFSNDAKTRIAGLGQIEEGWQGLDIGPATRRTFAKIISGAGTIVWNGPMGCFEMENFAAGTNAIAQAVAASRAVSIIGGGDSVSAVNKAGLADRMTHISTGGGASLEFLEGKELPGVVALSDK